MSLASEPLPTDPDELRLFAAGLQAELARKEIEIAANALEIHAKALHIEKLKAQLAVLRRAVPRQSRHPKLLRRRERRPTRAVIPSAGRYPSICRARLSPMIRPAPALDVAAPYLAGSARTSARCWNMCRRASRSSCMSGRS
jgi:hypothetical protein